MLVTGFGMTAACTGIEATMLATPPTNATDARSLTPILPENFAVTPATFLRAPTGTVDRHARD
jgi:hypothetical protein